MFLARLDNLLLTTPGSAGIAGNAVFWAKKSRGQELPDESNA
jgi:hypothetical protein